MKGVMAAIPFEIPSPQIPFVVMHGDAGGAPLRVLFDSGNAAPFQLLLSDSRGPGLTRLTGGAAQVTAAVAGGGRATLTPAVLAKFRLGPIRLTNLRVAISPSVDLVSGKLPGGIDAVVGYEFAAGRIVSVDYHAHRIDFAAASGRGRAVPIGLTPGKHLTMVEATINGRGPFHMALDTGAGGTLLSPDAAARAGLGEAGPKVRVGGAGGLASEARVETADVAVGENRWPGARLFVADLMEAVSAEAGAPVDGVLGAPLFAHGRLILDYPGRRVWIGAQP
jgi:hypothetical protein